MITTDTGGLVKQMNPVAEMLTGWLEAEAAGITLDIDPSYLPEGTT